VLAYIQHFAGQRFDPRIAQLCERPDVLQSLLGLRQGDSKYATIRPPA
jgi:hypothetical protein